MDGKDHWLLSGKGMVQQGQGIPLCQPNRGLKLDKRDTNLPWPLFLHCRSKAGDKLALGVCAEWLERTGTSTRRL